MNSFLHWIVSALLCTVTKGQIQKSVVSAETIHGNRYSWNLLICLLSTFFVVLSALKWQGKSQAWIVKSTLIKASFWAVLKYFRVNSNSQIVNIWKFATSDQMMNYQMEPIWALLSQYFLVPAVRNSFTDSAGFVS